MCNKTRLAVKNITKNLTDTTIIIGRFKGEDMLIPEIPLMPTEFALEFKHDKFSVSLAFAMSIYTSQGQSLDGHLYIACSRVGKPSALFFSLKIEKKLKIMYTTRHYNKVFTYDHIFVF